MKEFLVFYRHYNLAGEEKYDRMFMTSDVEYPPNYKQIKAWEERLERDLCTSYHVKVLSFSELGVRI